MAAYVATHQFYPMEPMHAAYSAYYGAAQHHPHHAALHHPSLSMYNKMDVMEDARVDSRLGWSTTSGVVSPVSSMSSAGLPAFRPAWDMDTLKASIRNCQAGCGEVRRAIETCTFRPREQAFTTLINISGRLKEWRKAIEVFETMKDMKGVRVNTYTFSALISACSSCGEWDKALEIFEEMKTLSSSDPGCRPNQVTYGALITACERGGKYPRALILYDEMRSKCINPDKITFVATLSAAEKVGDWSKVEAVLDAMHEQGLVGTSTIYVSLLGYYAKTGDWSKALDIFLTMQMLGVSVDQNSCRTLMKVLEAGGCSLMALQLLEAMWDAEMVIDLETYNSALCTLEKQCAVDDALKVYKEIERAQLKINLCTATAIIGVCVRGNRKSVAKRMMTKFRGLGLQVDIGMVTEDSSI